MISRLAESRNGRRNSAIDGGTSTQRGAMAGRHGRRSAGTRMSESGSVKTAAVGRVVGAGGAKASRVERLQIARDSGAACARG